MADAVSFVSHDPSVRIDFDSERRRSSTFSSVSSDHAHQNDRGSIAESHVSDCSVQPRDRATKVPAERNLEWWDVAALIINKMIGTGIFTGPYLTIAYTQSKGLTMTFWLIGFIYTLISMWQYLELARELPYTGGEMVYLDHLFPRPWLLVYVWYTFYFVLLYTTTTNALQFARYVLFAADISDSNPDRRLICFIAFCITTFVCLLLYFDSLASRYVNAATALAKVILLVCVFAAGCWYLSHNPGEATSWSQKIGGDSSAPNVGWSQALLLVFFSYHGWENATFVAGEIPKYTVLRNGFIAGVVTVGVLYVSVVAIFCAVFPSNINDANDFKVYMGLWFGNSDAAKQASDILIAISALGSMISVAYTCVRVKQSIGWANVLPLSNLWRRTDLSRHVKSLLPQTGRDPWQSVVNQAIAVRRGTPEGGLIIHYLVTVISICVSTAFNDIQTAISASASTFIYGHFFIEAAVGLGYALFFQPGKRNTRPIAASEWNAPEPFRWFSKKRRGFILLGSTTFGISAFVIIAELTQKLGRYYFAANMAVFGIATLYWLPLAWCRGGSKSYRSLGLSFEAQLHGKDDDDNPWRQCSQCARLERGQIHRHREDGYLEFNSVRFMDNRMGRFMAGVASWINKTEDTYTAAESDGGRTMGIQMQTSHKRPVPRTVEQEGSQSRATSATIAPDRDGV